MQKRPAESHRQLVRALERVAYAAQLERTHQSALNPSPPYCLPLLHSFSPSRSRGVEQQRGPHFLPQPHPHTTHHTPGTERADVLAARNYDCNLKGLAIWLGISQANAADFGPVPRPLVLRRLPRCYVFCFAGFLTNKGRRDARLG